MMKRNKSPRTQVNKCLFLFLLITAAVAVLFQLFPDCAPAEEEAAESLQKRASLDARTADPFLPFIKIAPDKEKIAKMKEAAPSRAKEEPVFVPPLQRYDIKEFRLRGIARGGSREVAVVEDGSGKIYTLHRGTAIGLLGGQVIAILPDKIIVEQKEQDTSGKEISKRITLKLEREEDRGKL